MGSLENYFKGLVTIFFFFFAKNNENANFRKILKCAQKIFKLESEMQKS